MDFGLAEPNEADIAPRYYAQRGFQLLDAAHQTRAGSLLMARFAPGFDKALVDENAGRLPPYL